jgi:hypothetical protein
MNKDLKLPEPDTLTPNASDYKDDALYLFEENFQRGWKMSQKATVKAVVVWLAEHYLGSSDQGDAFIFTKDELRKLNDLS